MRNIGNTKIHFVDKLQSSLVLQQVVRIVTTVLQNFNIFEKLLHIHFPTKCHVCTRKDANFVFEISTS